MKDAEHTWQERMAARYPELMDCHPSVHQGWENILDRMLESIRVQIKQIPDFPPARISQIKEEFGTLRITHHGGDDTIRGIIIMAESISHRTCEECGCPATAKLSLYRGNKDWIRTLCHRCSEALI